MTIETRYIIQNRGDRELICCFPGKASPREALRQKKLSLSKVLTVIGKEYRDTRMVNNIEIKFERNNIASGRKTTDAKFIVPVKRGRSPADGGLAPSKVLVFRV